MQINSSTSVAFSNDGMSAVSGQVSGVAAQNGGQMTEIPQTVEMDNQFKLNNEQERLKEAVDHANKALEGSDRSFKYEIHEPTNQVVVSVVDNKTHEIIKEIPSKKLLDVVSKLMELAGVFIDERR